MTTNITQPAAAGVVASSSPWAVNVRDRVKELRRVRAADLLPNPRNWRRHPQSQADALRGLLAEVGYAGALLARETEAGLQLIDGHLRAEITPDMAVPVLVLDVTEEEAAKLLLTYDPLTAMAVADREMLASLMGETAFESDAVAAMLEGLAREAGIPLPLREGLTDPDDLPDLPKEAVSKPGDLWLLDEHRVLCGDSASAEDIARLMAGEKAALLWTDPPYGVDYEGGTRDALRIANDDVEALPALLRACFSATDRFLEPGAPFYIAHPAGPNALCFWLALSEVGWRVHQELVWIKDSLVLGHADYHYRHEPILYGWTPGPGRSGRGKQAGSRWYGDHSQTSVFEIPRPKASRDHPTSKPVELVERQLANSSRPGETVLDPFLGSGTALIACERLGRRCRAIEIEPRYVDVAVQRWEAYTARKAVRA